MAIVPTGAIYKSLRFDGIDSRDYGVYISGDGVFNAPERDVEMIEIPGRNGAFALDNDRFRNIEVTYPGGMFADSEEDFAAGISAFRNYLCSRKGYCRLEDDYHPGEYRMAVYKGGLEVTPAQLKAGEFNIVFDCKPQRWLTSGEEPIDVDEPENPQTASGSIVTFDADAGTVISSLKVQIAPKQAGSGDPSPTNIRPITGWTDADVNDTGINIWDEEWEIGDIDQNGQNAPSVARLRSKNYIPCQPETTYYFHCDATIYSSWVGIFFYDADKNFLNRIFPNTNKSFTSVANAKYMRFYLNDSWGGKQYTGGISINYPSTDTDYHAYNGHTTPVPLGQTVYGATGDVVTGEWENNMAMVDLGTLNWTKEADGVFSNSSLIGQIVEPKTNSDVPDCLCSGLTPASYVSVMGGQKMDNSITVIWETSGIHGKLFARNMSSESAAAFKTAMSGVMLAYKLITPTPFTTTPTEVRTLLGTNNVWSVGDVEVTWAENPKTITNPTLFDAKPLLQVWGYGDININDEQIHIEDKPIGYIAIANSEKVDGRFVSGNYVATKHYTFNGGLLNQGDSITLQGAGFQFDPYLISGTSYKSITSVTATVADAENEYYQVNEASISTINPLHVTIRVGPRIIITSGNSMSAAMAARYDLEYGTAFSHTSTVNVTLALVNNNDEDVEWSFAITVKVEYDGAEGIDVTVTAPGSNASFNRTLFMTAPQASAISTKGALGEPLYFDMDLGEAYKEEAGEIISVNSAVTFPAELPVLVPGLNTITHTGHIRQLKVVPRWWEV